jgi:hypothetical protein
MSTATDVNYEFTINGLTPLLMHADNLDANDMLKDYRDNPANKAVAVKGDDRSPPWTWQTYLCHDGSKLTMPNEYLMGALRKAGTSITMTGKKTLKAASQSDLLTTEFLDFYIEDKSKSAAGKTAWKQVFLSEIQQMFDQDFATQCKEAENLGFRLFKKRCKVGNNKHVRVRPRFDKWLVRGTITVLNPAVLPEVKVAQLFAYAGKVGLGDWRPSSPNSPGPFGQFTAEIKRV